MAVNIDRSKPVEFSDHAHDKMLDRGADEKEVLGGERMKVGYDPTVDALTIRLIEQRVECETLHLNDQVAVDIGPDERLVAIEILDTSELIPSIKERGIAVENLTVTEGA